jgi:hypothetical protein
LSRTTAWESIWIGKTEDQKTYEEKARVSRDDFDKKWNESVKKEDSATYPPLPKGKDSDSFFDWVDK